MSYIAPAGTPITLQDISAGLATGMRADALSSLQTFLRRISGTAFCWPMCSARAGMVITVRAMARAADPTRTQVIVPGYTCYSVPASILRADLQPVFCDIDPTTLSFDLDQLAQFRFDKVLAIVSANLYGIPNELTAIETLARENGVFLLDDAAQALGARQNGRAVGGFGDAGLYSFDKGKNIATIQGGAIVARAGRVAQQLQEEWDELTDSSGSETFATACKLLVYALLLKPSRYGIVRKLPFVGLGRTVYDESFPVTRYSALLAGVAIRLGEKLESINQARTKNAERLRSALDGVPGIELIQPPRDADPVYLRLPIRVDSPRRRAALLAELDRQGIGATASYPNALADVPELASYAKSSSLPGARRVAETILTLPTHAYCPEDLPDSVRRIVDRSAQA